MLTFEIWLAVLLSSVLPFLAIAWLWKRRARNKPDWVLTLSLVGAFSLLAFIATPWAMTSYYLRYILVVFFTLAAYFSFRKVRKVHLESPSSVSNKSAVAIKAILLLALLLLDIMAISTYFW